MRRFIFIFSFISTLISAFELAQVIVQHRHGARTNSGLFWNSTLFPNGPGPKELTQAGWEEMRNFGKKLRSTYIETCPKVKEIKQILPKNIKDNTEVLYVLSSPKNRTLRTVNAVLLGMYPEQPQQKIKQSDLEPLYINNSAINIIYPDSKKDYLFHSYSASICPAIKKLQKEIKNSEKYKKKEEFYRITLFPELIEKFNKAWNITLTLENFGFSELSNMKSLLDTAKFHNLSHLVPEFSSKTLQTISEAKAFFVYEYKFGSEEIVNISVTKNFEAILLFLNRKINGEDKPIFVDFSTHDRMLSAILTALVEKEDILKDKNIYDVPYGSALIYEIYREENKYFVKAIFNGIPLKLKKCGYFCPSDSFERLLKEHIIVENFFEKCLGKSSLDVVK